MPVPGVVVVCPPEVVRVVYPWEGPLGGPPGGPPEGPPGYPPRGSSKEITEGIPQGIPKVISQRDPLWIFNVLGKIEKLTELTTATALTDYKELIGEIVPEYMTPEEHQKMTEAAAAERDSIH